MLKKTITYTNFNGEEVSEDFFFHLSKAELVELEMGHEGGLSEALQRIIAAEDNKSLIAEFKNIILGAYGQKSPDGRQFIKTEALRQEFASTEAYSTLFMELVTETDKAVEFINGVIPMDMAEEAAKLTGGEEKPALLTPVPEPQVLTRAEFMELTAEEVTALGPRLKSGEVEIKD